MFVNDFVFNGQAMGNVGSALESIPQFGNSQVRWDPGFKRPYFDKNGRPAVSIHKGRWTTNKGERVPLREHMLIADMVNNYGIMDPTWNATALRKEEFIELDKTILRAARFPMDAWQDLSDSATYGGFNGMGRTVLEHEMMTDPGEAMMDMDALTEGRNDQPLFSGQGLPLPILHSDFNIGARKLAISRQNGSSQLDVVMGEAAGRRIGELLEKITIGVTNGLTYGGHNTALSYVNTPTIYGYTNLPQRLTKTNFTAPTAGGWAPTTTLNEYLAALNQLKLGRFRGPFMVYTSNDWDTYLDADYYYALTSGAVAPSKSLRTRLKEIKGIIDIKRLDFLFASQLSTSGGNAQTVQVDATLKPWTTIFVQLGDPNVARAVNGMGITTLQWPSIAGMKLNFKVMCIMAPQLRFDAYGNCGILHGTTT